MTKKIFLRDLSIVCILLITVLLTNSMHPSTHSNYIGAQQQFTKDLDELSTYALSFENDVKNKKKDLTKTYQHLRCAYKKVEFLATYLDPRFVNSNINGAPLPKLPSVLGPSLEVVPSKGLQVIDELLYTEKIDYTTLLKQATLFTRNISILLNVCKEHELQDRFIFESMRLSIVRLSTMGLTGFDTPSSLLSLEDSKIVLSTINNYLKLYHPKNKNKLNSLQKRITIAISLLNKESDFNSFDRYAFIKDHLNLISTELLTVQLELNIETENEVITELRPTNPLADHLFSADFLNPDYFAGQTTSSKLYSNRVELGKLLFFDPILSINNERSCASCHNPNKAFTDGQEKSVAFDFNGTVERNSPCLINSIYADRFFWDLRAQRLSDQIEHVVLSKKEFNTDFQHLSNKLNKSPDYKTLFNTAFPKIIDQQVINKSTISEALSSYVASLQGFNSKFDKNIRNEEHTLTKSEINGFNLFMGKANCGTCHFSPTFSGLVPPFYTESESESLGITEIFDTINPVLDSDMGRYNSGIIKERTDFYKRSFKTVSIRNVALTAPYMHNGAFKTLDDVLFFYNKGGGKGMALDIEHQTLSSNPIGLNETELSELKSFMLTLTDTSNTTQQPITLPSFGNELDTRKIGGTY